MQRRLLGTRAEGIKVAGNQWKQFTISSIFVGCRS